MGLQTSVLRHNYHQGKMTVGKPVKKRSGVKLKPNHCFLKILTYQTLICAWFADFNVISAVFRG